LDYHYSADTAAAQKALFSSMLDGARHHGLPVVVHSREAEADTLALLENHRSAWRGDPDRLGVLHCFTGDLPFAQALLALGMMISFSGIVTFKNAAALRDVAAAVPDDRLLIETDSPYLAPVPYRGKRNEPAYVCFIASALAELRGCEAEKIAR
jgi:TatD DNase family protein